MKSLRCSLLTLVLAGVLILIGGLPMPGSASTGSASDRYARGKVIAKSEAKPDTLKSQPASVWSAHDARRWRVGVSISALGFIRADDGAPLYGAHAHYRLWPRWTLNVALGIAKAQLDVPGVFPAVYQLPPQEYLTLTPISLGITYHLHPASGIKKRGYITAGASILYAYSRKEFLLTDGTLAERITTRGWLVGPFVGIGMEIPINSLFLVDVEVAYRGTVNTFRRGSNSVGLETLILGIGFAFSL